MRFENMRFEKIGDDIVCTDGNELVYMIANTRFYAPHEDNRRISYTVMPCLCQLANSVDDLDPRNKHNVYVVSQDFWFDAGDLGLSIGWLLAEPYARDNYTEYKEKVRRAEELRDRFAHDVNYLNFLVDRVRAA